ncbi:HpcH/HpaI aldolase/citrate lyase family protein [Sphingomonas radiodurans]|uniref:HpcH/HpaI aldolase/citrate lyase family protein n=1 Tax=Sphingomonas radiodurans TaxID=2890321 RepID=UPI001E5908D9|nr:aldolase/citrate lyase family protein [Sphingomonas radiodurans]WBH18013.1 aldolase/citrate lyase family protein [Sphingomonas radiodurans]
MSAAFLSSLLFVSAATPTRIVRALDSDADVVCIDLEDSVPAAAKAAARVNAIAALDASPRLCLRINSIGTVEGLRDLLALVDHPHRPALLLLPMIASAADVRIVASILPGVALVPLIETPAGLRQTARIASEPSVAAVMFGGGDMSAELGVELAWEPLLAARGAFLLGCAEAGKPAIDVPFIDLANAEGLAEETRRAKAMGFQAKAAIHPTQIDTINGILRPTAAEVADARAAVAAFAAAGGGAIRFNGRMLEAPVMRRLNRILAQSDHQGSRKNA